MKSILKYMLKNGVVILSIIDIAIILWIIWFEEHLQYEPLLDYSSNIEDRKQPLVSQVYNTIIMAIVANIIVLVSEFSKIRNCGFIKCGLIIGFIYYILIIFCMLLGYYHISIKSHNLVIYEGNILFRFPIWIFGKELFISIVTVTNLYVSLCVIHVCICSLYIYLYFKEYKKLKDKKIR